MTKKTVLITGGVIAGGLTLFAHPVFADNCGSFSDCFDSAKAGTAAGAGIGILAAIISAGLDYVPVIGQIKAGEQLITGKDWFTNEEVPRWESAIGLVPVFGKVAAKGLRYGMVAARGAEAMEAARMLKNSARNIREGMELAEAIKTPIDIVKSIKDTSEKIGEEVQGYLDAESARAARHAAGAHAGSSSGAHQTQSSSQTPKANEYATSVQLDQNFIKFLIGGFDPISGEAPATIAHDTLKDLAKKFGKDSNVLKSIAKANDKISDLPKDATMHDVLNKLRK